PAQRDRSTLLRLGLLSLGCTGAAANLPPCPTRRSSDLVGLPWGCAGRHAPIRTRPSITKAAETLRRMAEASIMAPRPRHGGGPGDRKSTRLNSSHVKISYAVFCLKKKTTQTTEGAEHRR